MRVAIAGAGNVGRSIATELLGNGHQVLLIERETRAMKVASVPGAEWLQADACELDSLVQARAHECDVVVAATGDDKVNLVVSLLAKTEFGVDRVVARVNHPKNEWLFNESWGVDVSVSSPRLLAAVVEEAVSVGDLVRLLTFRQGQANLVELTLSDDAPIVGQHRRRDPLAAGRRPGGRAARRPRHRPDARRRARGRGRAAAGRHRRGRGRARRPARRPHGRRRGPLSAAGYGSAGATGGRPARRTSTTVSAAAATISGHFTRLMTSSRVPSSSPGRR